MRYIKICKECGNTYDTEDGNQQWCPWCIDEKAREFRKSVGIGVGVGNNDGIKR